MGCVDTFTTLPAFKQPSWLAIRYHGKYHSIRKTYLLTDNFSSSAKPWGMTAVLIFTAALRIPY